MNGMNKLKVISFVLLAALFLGYFSVDVYAGQIFPGLSPIIDGTDDPAEVVPALQILFLVSIVALAPSLLVLLTGFVRIIIVLSFMRQAMATQMMPPNQVMVGIALFLTLFLMAPVLSEINQTALIPFGAGELSIEEAFTAGMAPIRRFMMDEVMPTDLNLFLDLAGETLGADEEPGNHILIPAFILSELAAGFMIGFFIYLPFIAVDMVVASVLMAMGMMMLPPAMISLPFKIMLFILAGGWSFVIESLMRTFTFY